MSDHRPHAKIACNDPLANRLIEDRIRNRLRLDLAYADATCSTEEMREGVRKAGVHLDEFWVHLVPDIVDELRRAGLLKSSEAGEGVVINSEAATPMAASGTPMDLIGKTVRWESKRGWFTARVIGEYDDGPGTYDGSVLDPGTYRDAKDRSIHVGEVVLMHPEFLTVIDSEPDTDDPECE